MEKTSRLKNGKCKKEFPFAPIGPISRIAESITYVESMRDWGSNPPPATNLFQPLTLKRQNCEGTISFPCSIPFVSISESSFLMQLSCFRAAVCRPPRCWRGVWFFCSQVAFSRGFDMSDLRRIYELSFLDFELLLGCRNSAQSGRRNADRWQFRPPLTS
jgi:hypothetical protein